MLFSMFKHGEISWRFPGKPVPIIIIIITIIIIIMIIIIIVIILNCY